ncbi:cyclase family protein [Chloroflexota bacterium]|nr:cyclase family protein [Chloroflexota bacterium]
MQRIYDISLPITPEMAVWPGDPEVTLRRVNSLDKGDSSNVTQLRMSVHTGTHIDAPLHFLKDGKSIGEISLQKLIGKALVMEMGELVDVITQSVLEQHPQIELLKTISKVLLKTRNSAHLDSWGRAFHEDYVALDSSGAGYLAQFDLNLIGVDYLSVAAYHDTHIPHKLLLEREIVLLEGITLAQVTAGIYDLYCLPMNLEECEGAPARAILISE